MAKFNTKGRFYYGNIRYCTNQYTKQSMLRQIRNIKAAYPTAIIIKEVYTGTKLKGRKDFEQVINRAKSDDIFVFDSVSRMCRNADEGCELYEQLFYRGINLVFLQEPHINTDVFKQALNNQIQLRIKTGNQATDELMNTIIEALNKFTLVLAAQQIRIAFEQAEKEVEDLHQRTREGIETARLSGKQIGQKEDITLHVKKKEPMKKQIRALSKSFDGSNTDIEVMKITGVSKNTYYKYKKELLQEFLAE